MNDEKDSTADTARTDKSDSGPITLTARLKKPDTLTTRLISRELTLDGVTFHWWAVGENPSLVTVSNPIFGNKADFVSRDREGFAVSLARRLLVEHYQRAAEIRKAQTQTAADDADPDLLDKPGWFSLAKD